MKTLQDIREGFFNNTGAHNDPEYIFQSIMDDCKNVAKELKQQGLVSSPDNIERMIKKCKYNPADKLKSLPYNSSITIIKGQTPTIYLRVDPEQNYGGYDFLFNLNSIIKIKGRGINWRAVTDINDIYVEIIFYILKRKKIEFKLPQ